MSRLEEVLREHRSQGRKLLVPFVTGRYPDRDTFVRLLLAVEAAGADAVEVGIPFSDPSADGPTIQLASEVALRGGATVRGILDDVAAARQRGLRIPLLFMTYFNPVLAFGPTSFAEAARRAGADGVLVVDLPVEEAEEFGPAARAAGLDTVFLVAPTTPEARVPRVLAGCGGFVYCVSVTGVTGEKRPVVESVRALVEKVRSYCDLPVLVGFGVETPDAASDLAGVADGVIVGSALLRKIQGLRGEAAGVATESFVSALRRALDRGAGL